MEEQLLFTKVILVWHKTRSMEHLHNYPKNGRTVALIYRVSDMKNGRVVIY